MGLEGFRWVLDCSSRTELLSSSNPGSAAASFASNVRQRCFVVRACSILLVRHLSPLRKFVCWNLQCAPRCPVAWLLWLCSCTVNPQRQGSVRVVFAAYHRHTIDGCSAEGFIPRFSGK